MVSTLALLITFAISIIIILIVIGINIYMLVATNRKINKVSDDVSHQQLKLDSVSTLNSTAISILDLAEFKDLDPYLKEAYKRYIVNILSASLMKTVNKTMADADMKNYLSENQAELDTAAYAIAKELKTGGLDSLLNMYS